MTDFIEQERLVDSPVFIDGTLSVANGEHTLAAIGDIDLPDEATLDDGGDLARSPDILSSLALDLERTGLAGEKRTAQETVTLQGVSETRVTFDVGAKWSNDLKNYAGTNSCELPHVALVLSGTLRVNMTTKNRNHVRAAKAGLRKAKRRKELQQRRAQQPKPDLLQYFNTTAWDEAQKIPAWEEAQKMRERSSALRAYSGPSTQPGGMHYYLNNTTWAKRCVPHLDDPELRRILHREFGLFVISHYGVLKGHRMPGDFETWANKARPPWWKYVKDLACHYLVNVNLRLAMLAQPDRPWRIVTSGLHSTVWDGDKSIFDLNYSGGTTPADQTLLLAAGIWGGIAPGYTISDYVDPLPVGEYMPLGIFFPSRNEAEWAQWEKGIEATPALRLALLKGLRRGHLAYLVNKPNYPRALKILNRGMPSAVEITTMADEAHSSIQRLAAEVMVKPNHAIDPAVEATGNAA